MIRFVFRMLSLLSLMLAVVAGVMDSIQSVSSSEVMLTSVASAWQELDAASLELARETLEHYIPVLIVLDGLEWVLRQPAFAVFLSISLVLWMIGYRKPSLAGRFAA